MGNAEFAYDFGPLNFTPEQVQQVNDQAAKDVQNYLQSPEYKQDVVLGQQDLVITDPSNVVDPSWDPELLNEVLVDLGKAYSDPVPENQVTPTFADVNLSLKGSMFYQETAKDKLQGKYWPIQQLEPMRSDDSYFVFNYYDQVFYALTESKWIFSGLGYNFLKARDFRTYAIDPGMTAYEVWPYVDFGQKTVQPVKPIPDEDKPKANPLDDLPFVDIPRHAVAEIAPPLQNTSSDINWPLLLSGSLIAVYLLRGK